MIVGRVRAWLSSVPWWAYLVTGVVAAVGGRIAWLEARVGNLEQEVVAHELREDSLEAAADSTRELKALAEEMGGQLRIFQRRAFQVALERDELDRQLDQESRARIVAEARIDSLRASGTGTVSVDTVTDTRSAAFHVEQDPFTVRADVTMPPAPREASVDFSVDVAPALVGVRLGCREATERSIRSASVLFTTPPWLTIRVDSVAQEPGVCNPGVDVDQGGGFQLADWVAGPTAGALAGYSVDTDPRNAGIGAAIGFGVDRLIRWIF